MSCVLALGIALSAGLTIPAQAHETDNFFLPLEVELADLGDFLEAVHTQTLEEVVAEVNTRIERALQLRDPAARARQLARLQQPEALARALAGKFSAALAETRVVEHAVGGAWARATFPGQKTRHYDLWLNFSAHWPLDLRMLLMLSQCATLKAYGVYFGADKLTHFHHLGWDYYRRYQARLVAGDCPEEAYRKVLSHFADRGWLAEAHLFGTIGTGIYSNADMAVNHLGFKFFLNLTEPVVLQGVERPALVGRSGVCWRLNPHVRLRSGWFRPYFSDHWNEALNPSLYDFTMRPGIRRVLRRRAAAIVQFYTEKDGRPRDPAYYDRLARELSTYYGEPYGHSGRWDKLMTIGNTCLPALAEQAPSRRAQ